MSVADHPAFQGGSKTKVCKARRPVGGHVVAGPDTGGTHVWHLDCVLDPGHVGLHLDIRGKRWESV